MEQEKTEKIERAGASKSALDNSQKLQGCIKLLDFSLSAIGWRRGLGRGGAFLLVSPLLGPLPTRSSQGEDGELDAALQELSLFGDRSRRFENLATAQPIPLFPPFSPVDC
jgi:hypothetical protein